MINSQNHTKRAILHFKRWSNRSYAIFNSIGRVVHIGFLSTLIRDRVTVKSVLAFGLLNIIEKSVESDAYDDELLSQIELSDITFSEVFPILNTVSVEKEIGDSILEFIHILVYKNICKAFLRPFLFYRFSYLGKNLLMGTSNNSILFPNLVFFPATTLPKYSFGNAKLPATTAGWHFWCLVPPLKLQRHAVYLKKILALVFQKELIDVP